MSGAEECLRRQPPHEPWYERLLHEKTLNSTRRYVDYYDPEAPLCDLDLRLKSVYDQHTHWNKSLREVLVQPETLRVLTKEELDKVKQVKPFQLPPLTCIKPYGRILNAKGVRVTQNPKPPRITVFRHWESPVKESIHKVDNAISGEHSQETNAGYSRKPNGGQFMN
ncbi:unnamed protein product [Calicophoron daubneyi]|uniref:Uncharacterized protein n=1 Tax=Calicophoron daubneyi TaxID=300641 RepID=A0AAV2TZ75_CALDB